MGKSKTNRRQTLTRKEAREREKLEKRAEKEFAQGMRKSGAIRIPRGPRREHDRP